MMESSDAFECRRCGYRRILFEPAVADGVQFDLGRRLVSVPAKYGHRAAWLESRLFGWLRAALLSPR
jgi:hypothetical protein